MIPEFSKPLSWQRKIIHYFLPFIKVDRHTLLFLALLSLLTVASNAYLIWNLGTAVTLISKAHFEQLDHTLLLIAGIVLFNQIVKFVYAYRYQRMTLRFIDRVRGQMLSRIMEFSFPINHRFDKGDLLTRLGGNVDSLLTYVVNVPLNIVASTTVLLAYSSIVFWIDWKMALIALTMAPFFFLSQQYVAPKTGRVAKHFTEERARLVSIEEQTLANLRGISAFNGEDRVREKHRDQFDIARQWALKARQIRILTSSSFTILVYLAGLIIIYSGISSIKSGHLNIGVFISFLIYIRYLTGPVQTLARIPIQFQANRAAAERVMDVLQSVPHVKNAHPDSELHVTKGEIVFEKLGFTYPGTERRIFNNVSVVIHPGESVALVGPSGSGKSTFANLLLRFYDPDEGCIRIDGTDIRTVSLTSLREQVSIVWQEPFIINGSVRENLLLAKHDATTEQMIEACKAGSAWEFIETLEQGLDTVIGVNGIGLSAGQRQRVAIAQAFLRNSPLLILDEASASLDSHSERMIVEGMGSLREGRTTIIIAHRFSSIRKVQRIFYLNGNGAITVGTHDQLMQTHSDYRDAVNWQISQP